MPIRGVISHNLLMPINQLEGIQQDIPRTLALMPAATCQDYENIVARLHGVDQAVVDQTIALMEQRARGGMTPPRITLRDVPGQVKGADCRRSAQQPDARGIQRVAGIDFRDRSRGADERAAAAYKAGVTPAFENCGHDFLDSQLSPGCARTTTSAGRCPMAPRCTATTSSGTRPLTRSAQEIHELGLAEVKRIRAEMDVVMASTGFKGGFAEFAKFAADEPEVLLHRRRVAA